MTSSKHCSLCGIGVSQHPIVSDNHVFCCVGCQTVYNILSVRNELSDFKDNPLFKEAVRSGLISNPALLDEIKQNHPDVPDGELEKLHLEIEDLWCPSCAEVIKLLLLREKGVRNCVIDYATDLASIEFAPRYISKETILNLINKFGYTPRLFNDTERRPYSRDLFLRFSLSAFFSLNIMMFSYPIYASYFFSDHSGFNRAFIWGSFFSAIPILCYSAKPIFKRFWNSLIVGILGMEVLIVLGVSAAFCLSTVELLTGGDHVYFDSMSVIITFVLLGKMIESKAKFSSKDILLRLSRAIPKRGRKRFLDSSEKYVPVKEISQGDILVALTGEKIVLDGVVIEGNGSCDESVMTGEAIPVIKDKESCVLGGTILNQGCLAYRVTATEERTALHQIIDMVEQDISTKTVYTRAVDSIVKWFVPLVLLIAFVTAMFDVIRGISVLLISCPCAIGIAAPLAESQTLNAMANLGAIVRNRGCLPIFGRETVFVFDKTGTVTDGKFSVLKGLDTLTTSERQILKGLTSQSNHPISCAISRGISEKGVKFTSTEEIVGRGMVGVYKGKRYSLGSEKLVGTTHNTIQEGMTHGYFTKEDNLIGEIILGDHIRSEAKQVIRSLGTTESVLLSGDSKASVESVAKECGFDHWKSGYSPLEKRDYIDSLRKKGEVVCMMGDGVNDAPALTGAHVGISVVNATDMSIQVSDIMLTTDRLQVIPKIRTLARKGQRIVKQNLFWAFFYNTIGIGLAAAGYLNPIFATSAMVMSSLIVLFNARRIGNHGLR